LGFDHLLKKIRFKARMKTKKKEEEDRKKMEECPIGDTTDQQLLLDSTSDERKAQNEEDMERGVSSFHRGVEFCFFGPLQNV